MQLQDLHHGVRQQDGRLCSELFDFILVHRPESPQHRFLRTAENLVHAYLHNVQVFEHYKVGSQWDIHPNLPVATHLNLVPLCYHWTGHSSS